MDRKHREHILDMLKNQLTESDVKKLTYLLWGPHAYEDLPGQTRSEKIISLLELAETQGLISSIKDYVQGKKLNNTQIRQIEVREDSLPSDFYLPFTNRVNEIQLILYPRPPAYYVVDAPAGYGKTSLLKELKRHFDERGWLCTYVSTASHGNLPAIVEYLARSLGISLASASHTEAHELGTSLGNELHQYYQASDRRPEGMVLLIDVDKRPLTATLEALGPLVQDFLPSLRNALQKHSFFSAQHNFFRVILGGRYLSGRLPSNSLPWERISLEPFTLEIVRNTVIQYLGDQQEIDRLVSHLVYYTGGHPGCIARVLWRYGKQNRLPDVFFALEDERIWTEDIEPEIHTVWWDSAQRMRGILSELSVFRAIDHDVLRRLLRDSRFPGYKDEYKLADELVKTYLMDWNPDTDLLRDDITRRLLRLRLLREIGPGLFAQHCQRAQAICAEKLGQANAQSPVRWAIEYLFEAMQQHTESVRSADARQQLRLEFFGQHVPCALRLLIYGRKDPSEGSESMRIPGDVQRTFKRLLESDWEFQFTINYFLRKERYDEEPYNRLVAEIDRFFAQL